MDLPPACLAYNFRDPAGRSAAGARGGECLPEAPALLRPASLRAVARGAGLPVEPVCTGGPGWWRARGLPAATDSAPEAFGPGRVLAAPGSSWVYVRELSFYRADGDRGLGSARHGHRGPPGRAGGELSNKSGSPLQSPRQGMATQHPAPTPHPRSRGLNLSSLILFVFACRLECRLLWEAFPACPRVPLSQSWNSFCSVSPLGWSPGAWTCVVTMG